MQVEGRNPVFEALCSDINHVRNLFIEQGIKKDLKIGRIVAEAKKQKVHIEYKTKNELDKISETGVHQGVVAYIETGQETDFPTLIKDRKAFLVYIREALYEHNIGAIIRTAECVGATGIVLPPKINVSPQVRRAAMGATEHIPIVNYNLFQAIKEAQSMAMRVIGIERTDKSADLYQTRLDIPLMLIVGGEDRSLSEEITNRCDMVVEIPMKGKLNSLNMSVAAAISMYEVFRQNFSKKSLGD